VTGVSLPVSSHRVTVVSRKGCHLCDEAQRAVVALTDEIDFRWDVVDVDTSEDLQDEFGDRVPVILVDGREHGYWRVETARLRAALLR
jgi:glutaredoxin